MMQEKNPAGAAILIVEDHPPTLAAVKILLAGAFPSCRVITAESGEQALELCAVRAPHVVVMDIALPGIDGVEATRRIAALAPATRVVMHSSHDTQAHRDGAAAAGAAAFVVKNRTFTDLIPAISALIGSS